MSEMESKEPNSGLVIDLKVDRNLLNADFDCYRVSIDPTVTYCQSLDNCVNELRLSDEEYSYLHLSMASHFNHIFSDPFSPQTVFFATTLGQIMFVSIELISGKLTKPKIVYSIPDLDSTLISISFPNNELSLISNSSPKNPVIYLLSTPSRSASEPWVLLSTISLRDYEIRNTFHLFCSQTIDLYNSCSQIDFILCFVDKREENNDLNQNSNKSSFISVLNWFTITGNVNESNSWTIKRVRRMIGTDWPKYVSFDFIGSPFLCLVSDKDFSFVYDSEQPVDKSASVSQLNTKPNNKLLYTYCQTLEDICVTFKLPVHICKTDVSIDLKPMTISIKIKDSIEFEGQLYHMIDANTSVWTLQSEQDFQLLEITVNKAENGMVWKEFIKGDKNCMEIIGNELIEDIHKKLNHLTNEMPDVVTDEFKSNVYDPNGLEECDFTNNSLVFNRHNGNTHSISHRIDLSGNQWLFTIPVDKSDTDCNDLPYFVVRHDVDALVWSPHSSFDINQFQVKHLATFAAFGYVQASKTNTRFMSAPNDFKYVVIADGVRHVYVYRQPIDIQSGEMRNRRTGREVQTVAKQHIINLKDCFQIIGINATNDNIFILSNDKIFLIKL